MRTHVREVDEGHGDGREPSRGGGGEIRSFVYARICFQLLELQFSWKFVGPSSTDAGLSGRQLGLDGELGAWLVMRFEMRFRKFGRTPERSAARTKSRGSPAWAAVGWKIGAQTRAWRLQRINRSPHRCLVVPVYFWKIDLLCIVSCLMFMLI